MIQRKKLDIPTKVSGRPVSNRGVHLQPFGFHGTWLDKGPYWIDLLKSMGMSWVVLLTESDSVLEDRQGTSPLKALLDAGIIPIIRDKQSFPLKFDNFETVRRTVDLYGRYGLRPFWQPYNEPFDQREWVDQKVPPHDKAWEIIAARWSEAANRIVGEGAYIGFPDGPCYAVNPFERLRPAGGLQYFDAGMAFYAPHNYGKGRPLWYPYDAVSRHAVELTEDAYKRMLDDYQDDRDWFDSPPDVLNKQRQEWMDPTRTAIQDDVCWRGWERIVQWAVESLGYVPPMAMTEGGWTPRDRAGTGPVDARWPHTTPKMVAKKTLHMYDTPSPFFAICPWLLADRDMGGADGWAFDAWHGWAYNEKYGEKKPVITTLQESPPKEIEPRPRPVVVDVEGDTRDWAWVDDAYKADYRRGATTLRLIEVHEYEGPATLDVLVVDSDGLPVEGIEFYYHHPGAPGIEEGEWYGRGFLKATAVDGRLSFAAEGGSCIPGACKGAIWPKGKGDVLDGLGLLSGTRNRHLNGVWQLVEEGTPLAAEPKEESKSEQVKPEKEVQMDHKRAAGPSEPAGPSEAVGPKVDPRIASLIQLDLGGDLHKLQEVVWMDVAESKNLHHIYVDVVDEQGKRLAGEQVRVSWADGETMLVTEEKPGEPWSGNFGMFATMGSYAVTLVSASGTSDSVAGLGMGTPQEPHVKHHTSFGLKFVRRSERKKAPPPTDVGEKPKTDEKKEQKPAGPSDAAAPKVDPRIASLIQLDLGGDLYKLQEIVWMDVIASKNLHHIFVDVLDKEGKRLVGERIRVSWADGETILVTEEKPGEPWSANFGMFAAMGSYAVTVVSASGTSDSVAGLGMGTPQEPNIKHHTSFGLKFRKRTA